MERLKIIDEDSGQEFREERPPAEKMPPEPAAEPAAEEAPKKKKKQKITTPKTSGNAKGDTVGRRTVAPGKKLYRVTLNCPTPLAHKTLEVEAESEEEARKAYCRANAISGSVHVWDVVRIG